MRATLFIPELFWPEPEDQAVFSKLPQHAIKALMTLFSRGKWSLHPASPWEYALQDLLCEAKMSPATARYQADAHGDAMATRPPSSQIWCADLVGLRFHQDWMILADAEQIGLSLEESRALFGTLRESLPEFGEILPSPSSQIGQGYLVASPPINAITHSLSSVTGRRIDPYLPQGKEGARLRHLMNEAQMVLHHHPINQQRQAEGKATANSLWLWGEEHPRCLPAETGSRCLISEDSYLLAMGEHLGLSAMPPHSRSLKDWLTGTQDILWIDTSLLRPSLFQEGNGFITRTLRLEQDVFAPFLQALWRGKVSHLRVIAPTIYGLIELHCQRSDLLKIWQRPMALQHIAGLMAQQVKS